MRTIYIGLIAVLILFADCTYKPTSPGASEIPIPVTYSAAAKPGAIEKEPSESNWHKLLGAARKEQKVVIYSSYASEVRVAVSKAFKDKYDIEIEFMVGPGPQNVERLLSERRAGLYVADIFMGGNINIAASLKPVGALAHLKPVLMLPEVLDPKAWWNGTLLWLDSQETALSMLAYVSLPYVINTDLVKPEEVKSYKDLLNPRFKAKIMMFDPTIPGSAASWFSAIGFEMPGMGLDYMRELAKQQPLISRDSRQLVDWLAKRKYSILISGKDELVWDYAQQGAPLKQISPIEGVYMAAGPGYLTMINQAPHPNAAKVFINWLLSREGQDLFSKVTGKQSARVDIPADYLPQYAVRDPSIKYFWFENEQYVLESGNRMKVAEEIFGKR